MKQKIGRKTYDTEKAKEVGKQSIGYFGDSYGFEETLYKNGETDYFLHCVGGENSQYPEEILVAMNEEDTKEWLVRVCGAEYAEQILTETPKKASPKTTTKPAAKKSATPKKATTAKAASAKKPAAKKAVAPKAADVKATEAKEAPKAAVKASAKKTVAKKSTKA